MSPEKKKSAAASGVDRRTVLKGLAGSVAIGALTSAPVRAADDPKTEWAAETDVIVVGSGIAGTAAALAAAHNGAAVIMLEKMPFKGGTTAKSGGVFWIPNNPYLRSQGTADERMDALRYMVRLAHPGRYVETDPLLGLSQVEFDTLGVFYDNGSKVVETLSATAGLKLMPWYTWEESPFPDYFANLPQNKVHRGRSLVCDVKEHPERHLWPQGGGGGESLLWQLQQGFPKLPIQLLLEHRVLDVVRGPDGTVSGVLVDRGDPAPVRVHAKRAVIFCTGGFTHNAALTRNHLKGHIWGGCAAPGSTGDFIPIASRLGATLGNMQNAWWGQLPVESALKAPSVAADIWSTPGDSMIQVNKYGRRFVNEKIQYDERTQAHFTWDPVRAEYPNYLSFMIYDARTATRYAGYDPIPASNTKSGIVIEGATLPALASAIQGRLDALATQIGGLKLDAKFGATLRQTIARYNQAARTGVDTEFSRGESPIEVAFQFMSVPKVTNSFPNITMHPIAEKGPYYAVILGAGTLDTKGGPVINSNGQVLGADGHPIPGLYAAGNCVAHPAAQAYWGGGGTIGPHMTYGYIAGSHASGKPFA